MLDLAYLERLCDLAQRFGIKSLRHEDLSLEFGGPIAVAVEASKAIGEKFGMPTDDEMLLWSSPRSFSEDEFTAQPPSEP